MQRTSGGTQVLPDASTGPVYETEPLASDMYIQGLTQLHVEVSTSTVGGQLYAVLEDCDDSGLSGDYRSPCSRQAVIHERQHDTGEKI